MLQCDENEESTTRTCYVKAKDYGNNRACPATTCAIATISQPGQTLTVSDDSGDWYEIRMENGETAFIAGFLTSKTQLNP